MAEAPVTFIIIAITAVVSYVGLNNPDFFARWKHYPYREHHEGEYLRLLTSGFLHADLTHFAINMFVFWSFGSMVEELLSSASAGFAGIYWDPVMGHLVFAALYLLTIVLANVKTFLGRKDDRYYGAIGASGAVSGTLFCYVLFAPWSTLLLYFVIPMPAIVAAVGFLAYSQYAAKRANDNVDHAAHFWGAVAMPLMLLALAPGIGAHFSKALVEGWPF